MDFLLDFFEDSTPVECDDPQIYGRTWTVHVDGSFNQIASGAGVALTSLDGMKIKYALRFNFPANNNEVVYEALLVGLAIAHIMGADGIHTWSESQLVINQVLGYYIAKEERMRKYLVQVQTLR